MQHLVAELVNQRLGLKMTQVSFRGTPEVSVALLGDQVGVTFDAMAAYISNTGPDKPLKVLAVSSEKRIEAAPDIPTFAELGYPELTASTGLDWWLPRARRDPLSSSFTQPWSQRNGTRHSRSDHQRFGHPSDFDSR